MKEILIRFNNDNTGGSSDFTENPFDVYVNGEKIPRLKRIEIDFQKYAPEKKVFNYDDFKYKIEQYVDVLGVGD